ncbi:poly-beta-hydroxybutyrate polymerase N-terminal domain-containing protein [Paraburkholderia bryophila]|uniref:poly-beta-hydroxybutyrate polymerase N-terminal domain-containing protein n=1 Tax=Paraburkholderia bryophila TaxID=420952 RepID=UPI0015C9547A
MTELCHEQSRGLVRQQTLTAGTVSGDATTRARDTPFRDLDHAREALIARLTAGLSPAALRAALADWLIHLAAAPGKQLELASLWAAHARSLCAYLGQIGLGQHALPDALGVPAPAVPR